MNVLQLVDGSRAADLALPASACWAATPDRPSAAELECNLECSFRTGEFVNQGSFQRCHANDAARVTLVDDFSAKIGERTKRSRNLNRDEFDVAKRERSRAFVRKVMVSVPNGIDFAMKLHSGVVGQDSVTCELGCHEIRVGFEGMGINVAGNRRVKSSPYVKEVARRHVVFEQCSAR